MEDITTGVDGLFRDDDFIRLVGMAQGCAVL